MSATFLLGMGIVHFLDASRMTNYTILSEESSFGSIFRLRVSLRITLLTDSIVLVVGIARRIGQGKSNSVMTSIHFDRHCFEIVGYLASQACGEEVMEF